MKLPLQPADRLRRFLLAALALLTGPATSVQAVDREVNSTSQFATALAAARPGDNILLRPGVYEGGHFRAGLTGVAIRSVDASNPAIIRGGTNGIQLSDATNVTLEHLIFEQQTGNGLNIDDGGSFDTPSTEITLRDLTVRDMNATGNNDGIKLSGVTGFLIDRVKVIDWGDGGSAIDPVGSHNGVIQHSVFRHTRGASSGVRPKGGSKNIAIYANRFEMHPSAGRAIQAGGSTGAEFFRYVDGDSGYEAANITAAGNLITNSQAPFAYVNIDGGTFHHNWSQTPGRWALRILNENPGSSIVDTQNGYFADNVVEYDGQVWSQAANIGAETLADTFTFARNQWHNVSGPTNINLPAPEVDGQYGTITTYRAADQIHWPFAWGQWLVNASEQAAPGGIPVGSFAELLLATPGDAAEFNPLADDPLTGEWHFEPMVPTFSLGPLSDAILIGPQASGLIPNAPGDYDRNGTVDTDDYDLWKRQFGFEGAALADGNGDGRVDLADYVFWRDHLGDDVAGGASSISMVPVPGALTLAVGGLTYLLPLAQVLRVRREKRVVDNRCRAYQRRKSGLFSRCFRSRAELFPKNTWGPLTNSRKHVILADLW